MQLPELTFLLLAHISGLGAHILRAPLAILDPAIFLAGVRDDLKDPSRLATGRRTLDLFFHYHAQRGLLWRL